MNDKNKDKIDLKKGIIEIEGDEKFVKEQIEELSELIKEKFSIKKNLNYIKAHHIINSWALYILLI